MTVFIFVIFVLYFIPISIGIFILRFLFIWMNRKLIARWTTFVLFLILVVVLSIIVIREYQRRTHTLEFQMNDYYTIEVVATEEESFLEWPVNFSITIKNKKGNELKNLELNTPHGPYLKFYSDTTNQNRLIIRGYNRNTSIDRKVYLQQKPIPCRKNARNEVVITGNFTLKRR